LRNLATDLNNGAVKNGDLIRIRSDEVAEMLRIRLAKRSARKQKRGKGIPQAKTNVECEPETVISVFPTDMVDTQPPITKPKITV